jgi:chromosome segregation ATPase
VTGYKLDNLAVLTENNAIGNVVTAGFWESDVIAALLAADPKKLIMFEPDNALYAAASAHYADNLNVEVCNATLANSTGQADYFVFTPNRFSSLLKPKNLLKVYRKNTTDNVVSIKVSTVKSVCEQEKILPCAGNILLLGVNCPSTILSDAAQTDYLSYFDAIVVRQPKPGLYETEQQQETLGTMLQEHQFSCAQEIAGDAMYTQFVYVRDHQLEKMSALQAKVTQAETRNAAIAKQLKEAESRSSHFESSATELNTHYSKLKAQCEELTAKVSALEIKGSELVTQNTQLDASVLKAKAQDEKLSADVTQKQTVIEQMAAQITALQNKEDGLVDSHKNKDTQIAELTSQRDQQVKGHQETRQQAESLKAQNEKLSADRAQKLAENEQLAAQVKAVQAKHTELAETQKSKSTQIAELTAQRDQQAKGHQETRQQAESLKAQNEKLNVDRAQKLTENEQLVAQVKELQAKQNQLAEIQKNKDSQITDLTAQRDQQAKGHQETRQQTESLKAQNETLCAHKAQKLTENERLVAQVSTLQTKQNELVEGHKNKDAQIVAVTEQRDKEAHWHQKNKSWAESLNKQCEELKVYSAERQKSADLALKLQTKAQVDLENLREKYQHKHINEQKLVALISELRTKLQQAADYYYELQEKHPELHEVTQTQVEPSNIAEYQTANVAELDNKKQPAKRKKRSKQAKSVTRGKS